MSLDPSRVDLIIKYALLLAGEEDDVFDRQLGPIHLIKYVYLADLYYAKRHSQTFTGAAWRFHNFGPWDATVYERVDPATRAIHAEQIIFESNYGKEDWIRYRLCDPDLLNRIEKEVPPAITLYLRRDVHRFLGDTPSLLDFIYKTKPMLCAAPREHLDFSVVAEPRGGYEVATRLRSEDPGILTSDQENDLRANTNTLHVESVSGLRFDGLSNKKKKRFHDAVRSLSIKKIDHPKLINPVKSPRFDDVYKQGLKWLDELVGSPEFAEGEIIAEFSDEIWKSSTRKGEDVS